MENKKLNEQELEQVTGGDIDIRKDLYENIILSTSAGEQGEPEPEPISISHLQAYCGTCKLYYSYNTDYCPRCGNPLMKP